MPPDQEDTGSSDPEDLVELIDVFHAMWNTHHVDGVLRFYTEDAVINIEGLPNESSISIRGKTAIQIMLQTYLPGWHVDARSHFRANANRVTWMARTSADVLRRIGVDWLEWKTEVILRNGKIAAHTVTLTSEAVVTLEAAVRDRR